MRRGALGLLLLLTACAPLLLGACAPDYTGMPGAAAAQPARLAALGGTPVPDPSRAARIEALVAAQEAART